MKLDPQPGDEVTFEARDPKDRTVEVDGVVVEVNGELVRVRVGKAGRMVVARSSITSVRRPA